MSIQLKNIDKAFEELVVYSKFAMEMPEKKISCILGPSGCGKTSLLNMIGGIMNPDSGTIEGVSGKEFSFIFQEPRLLPWKTVKANLQFVLRQHTMENKEKVIENNLRIVGLQDFAHFYPDQLSGGMKQRVAIARAFCYPSDIILMDEPLKTLDPRLKWNLMKTFLKIWRKDRRTVVFVTHDVDEALVLGEEIFVFSRPPVRIKRQLTNNLEENQKNLDSQAFFEQKKQIMHHLD
ncbi:MAG TPA: ABC transporter ATP-binding protein [Bacteroidales bacterium]|nr:ABC transporter ATP-binding protein [Bacteroidales bacterium]